MQEEGFPRFHQHTELREILVEVIRNTATPTEALTEGQQGSTRYPALSIVEAVVIALRHRRGRTLHELRRVMARFARSRALGGIAADLGL